MSGPPASPRFGSADTASPLRAYAELYRDARGTVVIGVLGAVLQTALLLPVPWMVGHAIDRVIPRGDTLELLLVGSAVVGLTLLGALVNLASRSFVVGATKRATADLRREVVERVHALPREAQQRFDRADLLDRMLMATARVDAMAVAVLGDLLPGAVLTAGITALLVILDWRLALVTLAIAPVMVLGSRLVASRLRPATVRHARSYEDLQRTLLVGLAALDLTRAQVAEEEMTTHLRHRLETVRAASTRRDLLFARHAVIQQALVGAGATVVLVVGGVAVASGRLTVGDLIAFYACVALLRQPVQAVAGAGPAVAEGRQSLTRIAELFRPDLLPAPHGGIRPEPLRGDLALEHVGFAYDDGRPVLHDVTLRLRPATVVALVGPNGSGKSTAVHLLLGEATPSSGRVTVDGHDLRDVDLRWLRRRVGVVHQDPYLLPGTVWDNLTYGVHDASDDEVRRALAVSTADEVVAALPGGLDAVVGEEGSRLSGGMRQRLAIARALVGQPLVLVLDEPTNHLDEASIARVVHNLASLPTRPAVLLVTHHRALLALAHEVVEVRDGRMVRRCPEPLVHGENPVPPSPNAVTSATIPAWKPGPSKN